MKFSELINENGVNWDKVNTIPEFMVLSKTPQSKRWHQEGDVLTHTKLVVKELQRRLFYSPFDKQKIVLMAAALCHDLGKAVTTKWDDEKGDYTTNRHGYEGEKIVRRLFFDEDIALRESVCFLVRWHMTMHHILDKGEQTMKILSELSYGYSSLGCLLTLAVCDAEGSLNEESLDKNFLSDKFSEIETLINNSVGFKEPQRFDGGVFERLKFFNDVNITNESSSPKFNVTLMIGVAGAGKDTWIMEHRPDDVMLSRDNIRTEIGIKGEKPFGTKEQEKEVTRIFNERLIKCCENKQNVIINNTNLLKKYRSEFVKMVLPYNPTITFVYVEPNKMEDCANRRNGQIKKDIVNGMWDRLEFPCPSECEHLLFSKQCNDGDEFTYEIKPKSVLLKATF